MLNEDDIEITTGYLPGLVGRVTWLHAVYYAEHWDFGAYFETRVATEICEFVKRYDENRDCTWSALVDGQIEASITIDAREAADRGAHLRWFIASDRIRGRGIGARLMDLTMDFCRRKGYPGVYLDTFKGLEPARYLYEAAGFRLVASKSGEQWGSRVEEQRYEVDL